MPVKIVSGPRWRFFRRIQSIPPWRKISYDVHYFCCVPLAFNINCPRCVIVKLDFYQTIKSQLKSTESTTYLNLSYFRYEFLSSHVRQCTYRSSLIYDAPLIRISTDISDSYQRSDVVINYLSGIWRLRYPRYYIWMQRNACLPGVTSIGIDLVCRRDRHPSRSFLRGDQLPRRDTQVSPRAEIFPRRGMQRPEHTGLLIASSPSSSSATEHHCARVRRAQHQPFDAIRLEILPPVVSGLLSSFVSYPRACSKSTYGY